MAKANPTMGEGERKTLYQFGYHRSPDQDALSVPKKPVVVVGAGPVGLSAAIDLASQGIPVVLLDDADRIGEGSRGLCYSKRALEIWDRLGVGERLVGKGVSWNIGRVYRGEEEIYSFDLLPETGHKMPAFINLQQYYLEHYLVERLARLPLIDLRWRNRVTGLEAGENAVRLTIATPEGTYHLDADWCIAADGARSTLRSLMGLDFIGEIFEDKFLIADIKMDSNWAAERRFWFNPSFHHGQSALMHRQPDNIWRIDLQLGPDADEVEEQTPERVLPRIRRIVGDTPFELEWVSLYRFQCRRMAKFLHGRVIFAGDAAHQVSPFGARGANSGVEDAENIAWKLTLVIRGEAGPALLPSYEQERVFAADMNIGHSTRSTDFIAPHSKAEHHLRDAVLDLSKHADFAKKMVNSGRLSTPAIYDTALSTPDEDDWAGKVCLGGPAVDAPMRRANGQAAWFTASLDQGFHLVWVKDDGVAPQPPEGVALTAIGKDLFEVDRVFAQRYDAEPGSTWLFRPDQHLCARWRCFDAEKVKQALMRAKGF